MHHCVDAVGRGRRMICDGGHTRVRYESRRSRPSAAWIVAPTGGDAVEQHLFALAEICVVPEFDFRPWSAFGDERTQLFLGRQPELDVFFEKVEAKAVADLEQVGDACLGRGVFLGAERTPDDEPEPCDEAGISSTCS